jgi:outer membrane biosynthesis protein TonB
MKPHRLIPFALLLALPAVAPAQSRDSTLVASLKLHTDSIEKQALPPIAPYFAAASTSHARKAAYALLLRQLAAYKADATAFWPRVTAPAPTPPPTVPPVTSPPTTEPPKPTEPPVVTQPPVVPPAPKPDSAPTTPPAPPPVVTPPAPAPTPAPTSTGTVGPASVAEQPRILPAFTSPATGRAVKVPAGADLQTYLNSAQGGDVLLLAPCATYTGNFTLPSIASASGSAWITVRTDTSLVTTSGRMTPSSAAASCLAKIVTPNYTSAIGTLSDAHDWHVTGVEITAASSVVEVNMLVRLGDSGDPQTSLAVTPTDLILDRVYIHGNPVKETRRCVALNSGSTAIVDSWIADCHHNGTDSQGVWGSNGPGPYLIRNNHIEGGHQAVFFGGGNPLIANLTPSDITIVGNHLTRPMTWQGVWTTKTIVEFKHGKRVDIEGNVIENVWKSGQAGFAILLKSENQGPGCGAPWTQTADVTIRYNRILGAASGINMAANPGPCPAVNMARVTITDNVVGPFNGTGDGVPLQLLGALADVIASHMTYATAGLNAISFDGGAGSRTVIHSNVIPNGAYGVKGSSMGIGTPSLAFYMPAPSVFANNAIVGGSCSLYPATTLCALPQALPLGYDSRAIGADTAKVNAMTKNAVIAP